MIAMSLDEGSDRPETVNGPVEFPVPGALPPLPQVDPAIATVTYHDSIVPAADDIGTVDSMTWVGWGMFIGTVAGAIAGLVVGIVVGVRSDSAGAGMFVGMFAAVVGAAEGWVAGIVVGLFEALANIWAQHKSLGVARVVHATVGLLPLPLVLHWPRAPWNFLLAIGPAAGGAISGALLAGRYRRLKLLYAAQRAERAARAATG
jgi:hypothetical protein